VDDLARVLREMRRLPMTRSSNRAPMASSTSQFCIAMLVS
jgi:hypothetical protein